MIHASLGRPVPVELTDDAFMRRRVRRLATVSLVALGLVWALADRTLAAPALVTNALALGWLLMPTVLAWSLAMPRIRYLLAVPASLVSVGLVAICVGWLPASPAGALGWLVLTGGVLLGGLMGVWLWFRVLPVPAALDDPASTGRWAFVWTHVGLVVAGWTLAALAFALG